MANTTNIKQPGNNFHTGTPYINLGMSNIKITQTNIT